MEPDDRRRIAVATVITVVALPALWLTNRDEAARGNTTPIAVVGGAGALDAVAPTPSTEAPDAAAAAFGEPDPAYLAGPSTLPPAAPQVAYAPTESTQQVTGTASYRRWESDRGPGACHSPVAPANARLTVTNVNNGRTITCTNVVTSRILGSRVIVVLDTSAFLVLADLVEAPLPVRISW